VDETDPATGNNNVDNNINNNNNNSNNNNTDYNDDNDDGTPYVDPFAPADDEVGDDDVAPDVGVGLNVPPGPVTPKALDHMFSDEGVRQGSVLSPLYFCLGMRPVIDRLNTLLSDLTKTVNESLPPGARKVEKLLLAYLDDILCGIDIRIVKDFLERAEPILAEYGLKLNRRKTKVFVPPSIGAAAIAEHLQDADFAVATDGIVTVGTPIGNKDFVSRFVDDLIEDGLKPFHRVLPAIAKSFPALSVKMLSLCVATKSLHLPRTVPHTQEGIDEAFTRIDDYVAGLAVATVDPHTRLHPTLVAQSTNFNLLPHHRAPKFDQGDYQRAMIFSPVEFGGLGVPSPAIIHRAAHTASVNAAIPHLRASMGADAFNSGLNFTLNPRQCDATDIHLILDTLSSEAYERYLGSCPSVDAAAGDPDPATTGWYLRTRDAHRHFQLHLAKRDYAARDKLLQETLLKAATSKSAELSRHDIRLCKLNPAALRILNASSTCSQTTRALRRLRLRTASPRPRCRPSSTFALDEPPPPFSG
jgi:hypothetical protein